MSDVMPMVETHYHKHALSEESYMDMFYTQYTGKTYKQTKERLWYPTYVMMHDIITYIAKKCKAISTRPNATECYKC